MNSNKFLLILFLLIFIVSYKTKHKFNSKKVYFSYDQLTNSNENFFNSEILYQKFSYLGKGSQFFVFESDDKKYVIKFMRNDKVQPPLWTAIFNNFSFSKSVINKKRKRFLDVLKSSQLVLNSNLNFGIVLHNLDGKRFNDTVTLVDDNKNKVTIDLNRTIFLIQKRATKLKNILTKNTSENKQKFIIDQFFQNIEKSLDQNVYNNTRKCMDNVGVNEDGITEFDIGDIHFSKSLKNHDMRNLYLKRFVKAMREHLLKELPDLIEYFDQTEKLFLKKS